MATPFRNAVQHLMSMHWGLIGDSPLETRPQKNLGHLIYKISHKRLKTRHFSKLDRQ